MEFEVTVPCIVNTAKIAAGAEIVLEWERYNTRYNGRNQQGKFKRKVIDAFSVGAPYKKKFGNGNWSFGGDSTAAG